jgi:peptide/nickel transport system substrate-binding protein
MQSQAKAAGIDINVVREPSDGYWDNVYMKKPWCASYWGGRPTIDWMLATAYTSDAVFNDTFWKNPKFDQLLSVARAETDNAKRAAQYAEAQQLLHDDGGIIVLMFANWVSANSKRLAHGELNSNYNHDGYYIYERWWFA